MSDLNIRNISPELKARVKARASMEKKNLRGAIIELLEQYAAVAPDIYDINAAHCPVNGPLISNGEKKKGGPR